MKKLIKVFIEFLKYFYQTYGSYSGEQKRFEGWIKRLEEIEND